MAAKTARAAAQAARPQPTATPYLLQAPTGGLNSRDAQAEMPETDALILDNLVPQQTWVEIRGGKTVLATLTGQPLTLMAYNALGSGVQQLFAGVNNGSLNGVFRVDNSGGGAGTAVVTSLAAADFDYQQFGTGSAEILYALNGADGPLYYDGTTWQTITTTTTPALTGGPSPLSQLSQVAVYQKRLWFVQAGTFNVYYLPQNVFGGALTLLPLAANFRFGGFLASIITISIDDASGSNDYIAFMSNQGEVVMFTGYDPAQVATFALAAVFRIGNPIGTGRKTWQKIGMDACIICQDGFVMLSEAMLTDRTQQKGNLSDKIRYGINQDMGQYSSNPGWSALLFPAGNKLLFTVPIKSDRTASFSYVMNTLNGSWSTWGRYNSALNMSCMENFNNKFYFGSTGFIYQGDVGLSDVAAPITWTAKQAYSAFGENTKQKRWIMAQPFFQTSGGLSVAMFMSTDFDTTLPSVAIPLSVVQGAVWNVSLWSTPTFWGDAQQIIRRWVGLAGAGTYGSIIMQASTKNLAMKWQATTVLFEPGGVFYGQ